VQLLCGAGRAEHVAIRAHQNGRSIDRLQPRLLFRGASSSTMTTSRLVRCSIVSAGRLAAKSGFQQRGEAVPDAIVQREIPSASVGWGAMSRGWPVSSQRQVRDQVVA